jgi:hypothetical protein
VVPRRGRISLGRLALSTLTATRQSPLMRHPSLQSSAAASSSCWPLMPSWVRLSICMRRGGWIGRAVDHLGTDPRQWPSGVRGGEFSPGLMTGLVSVTYLLTRAAVPPSVGPLLGLGV